MAHKDWKRYYAPIMVHRFNKDCRTSFYLFRNREEAYCLAEKINASKYSRWRVIGVAAIRGNKSNPELQKQLLDLSE